MATASEFNQALDRNAERIPCESCRARLRKVRAVVHQPVDIALGDMGVAFADVMTHAALGHPDESGQVKPGSAPRPGGS